MEYRPNCLGITWGLNLPVDNKSNSSWILMVGESHSVSGVKIDCLSTKISKIAPFQLVQRVSLHAT